jgi:hypothetical protein
VQVVNLFVDTAISADQTKSGTEGVENRDVLSDVELCYHWDELDATFYDSAAAQQTRSLSGATFDHFEVVKLWIFEQISDTEAMVHDHPYEGKPQNLFLASVLRLLHKLIVFGYVVPPI